MIKKYKLYNEALHYFTGIVGMPSGEYFDVTMDQYTKLNNAGLIIYDNQNRYFYFKDKDYLKIIDIISDRRKVMIKEFLQRNEITNYRINKDYTVEVIQDVKILENMKQLPVEFDFILGDFDISDCGLETLKGCPERIEGDFICINNNLKDLTFGPQMVEGGYNVRMCRLKSLKGAPKVIGDDFNAGENELLNLEGGPERVDGNYYCDNCLLISLQGCASVISGDFDCSFNLLPNLKGGPKRIYGLYDCSNNRIKNYDGAPEMTRIFKCGGNEGSSISELPEYKSIIK